MAPVNFYNHQFRFDDWLGQLIYEYLKDFRTYFTLPFTIYAYRFIFLRLQGEASELVTPDTETLPEQQENLESYPERFLVKKFSEEFLISTKEIEWLEAQGNYINLHVRDRAYPLRSAMQARLDPSMFVRVHRSYFININFLVEIEPLESGDARLTLRDGTQVQCSRTYRTALKDRTAISDATKPITVRW